MAYVGLAGAASLVGVVCGLWLSKESAAAVAAALAAVLVLPVSRVTARIDRVAAQREQMASVFYRAGRGALLPRVRDVGDPLAVGVHAAEALPAGNAGGRLPPYVTRDAESEVHAAVVRGGFVLLVGESTAGKSRLAYEAIRSLRPDDAFACPLPTVSSELLTAAVTGERRCVLWLDDLERYLGTSGVTAGLLAEVMRDGSPDVLVLATLRAQEHHRLSSALTDASSGEEQSQRQRDARDLLQAATVIRLERAWSTGERERAAHTGDARIARAVADGRFGVAEALACGPAMLSAWRDAWAPGVRPRAAAIMHSAVDCRRIGVHGPVPRAALAEMHQPYLEARGGDRLRPESFEEALAWLCTPVHSATGSMLLASGGGYTAFDYLIDTPGLAEVPPSVPLSLIPHLDHHASRQMGLALGRLGRWAEAGQAHRNATALYEEALGGGHEHTLASRYEEGFALSRTGRAPEALVVFEQVALGRQQVLGADHPATLSARQETAYVMGQLDRNSESHDVYAAVYATRVRVAGADHPDTLRCRHNLAFSLARLGRMDEGYQVACDVEAARARVLGPDHPDTLVTGYEVAYALGQLGRWEEALAAFRRVAQARERTLGAEHPETLAARYEVGISLGRLGRATEALQLYQGLIEDRTRIDGHRNPETLRARHGQGVNLGRLGRWEEALAEARAVGALREATLGAEHPDALASRRETAVALGWLERWEEALVVYREVADRRAHALGASHPDTLTSRNDQAHCLEQLGHREEAAALYREVALLRRQDDGS
ncbi:tetratricopeptide repeat protein [Streptomyces sp. NPDC059900]|uniref:tetratricopeptide repeat protein n=1 Tax=Streptomyces sp. NPDC059900 TaxID=3155816 RepID=UPI003449CC39